MVMDKLPQVKIIGRIWMRMLGPYSPGLLNFIKQHKDNYDAFIFVTYMYATAYYGLQIVPEKSILIPTAHDEPHIRYGMYKDLFKSARQIIYLTEEEKSLVNRIFDLGDKGVVLGAPVEIPHNSSISFRQKYGIDDDFILYLGRMDVMKNIDELLNYFNRYVAEKKYSPKLVLCGSGPLKVRRTDHIIPVGYVTDEDKYGAIHASMLLVQPSFYESFSYSVIEAMLCGKPVVVNGRCSVLKDHCEKSGDGLYYESYETFAKALDKLVSDSNLRNRMGDVGKKYVMEHYSSEAVGKKYITCIDGLINDRQMSS
jgi:glycosyltransferase involved in cell wall biosynthesis